MAKRTRRTKATTHERTHARQTGVNVKQLRAEQKAAESIEALQKAKQYYAELGDVNSCGDWLAEALKVLRTKDGSFDLEAFKACLKENGIEAPKVDQNKYGWRGRFRMCAGLMLRRRAAKQGLVGIGGKTIVAPHAPARKDDGRRY